MCVLKAEGKVCMHSWEEKCRARERVRKNKSYTENNKVHTIMALIAEIMYRTASRSNLEMSPSRVTFSDISRSNCLVFKLDTALALISPVFELIALPVAILQSY